MVIFTMEGFSSYCTNTLINLHKYRETIRHGGACCEAILQTPHTIIAQSNELESNQDSGAHFHLQKLWEKETN